MIRLMSFLTLSSLLFFTFIIKSMSSAALIQDHVVRSDIKALMSTLKDADPSALNQEDCFGNTALIFAVKRSPVPIIETLVKAGADPDRENKKRRDAFYYALKRGKMKIIDLLLTNSKKNTWSNLERYFVGGSVRIPASDGALFIIQYLLACDDETCNGDTLILHKAASCGCTNLVMLLIQKSQEPKIVRNELRPPHPDVTKNSPMPIDKYVNTLDSFGYSALHWAAATGHTDACKVLIENGASVNIFDPHLHETPLQFSAESGYYETTKCLLIHHADPNTQDKDNGTPLGSAALGGHLEVVQLLIAHEAHVKSADNNGYTVLHFAAQGGNNAIVLVLLKRQADVNARIKESLWTPLFCAAVEGHTAVAGTLISAASDIDSRDSESRTPLFYACKGGHKETVQLLISKKAEILIVDKAGFTPLHHAANNGKIETVKVLLPRFPDHLLNRRNENDYTAYDLAAINGFCEVMEIFINAGMPANPATNPDRKTTLHLAAEHNQITTILFLLAKGVPIDITDACLDMTPLHYAAWNSHKEAVKVLLEKGADRTVKSTEGKRPYDLTRDEEVKKLLT
jgi:ankyrin repeat protein